MSVDLQHLHEVCQMEQLPELDIFCRNLLYGSFRMESVSGLLKDTNSVNLVNRNVHASTTTSYLHQLDLVRQAQNPIRSEFVTFLMFLANASMMMAKECDERGFYSSDRGTLDQMDGQLQEAAESDLQYLQQFYQNSEQMETDKRIPKVGDQLAFLLAHYVNSFEVSARHLRYLMGKDRTVQKLLVNMIGLETRRKQNTSVAFSSVNRNYSLFVHDLTGARTYRAEVVLNNKSLSTVESVLTLSPSIGLTGTRTDQYGNNWPYIRQPNFLNTDRDRLIQICMAYNLFGLTELWFREEGGLRYDQVGWDTFDDIQEAMTPHYIDTISVTRKVFNNLVKDLRGLYPQTDVVAVTAESPAYDYRQNKTHHIDEYDEGVQNWQSRGERQVAVPQGMTPEAEYEFPEGGIQGIGEPTQAEYYSGWKSRKMEEPPLMTPLVKVLLGIVALVTGYAVYENIN